MIPLFLRRWLLGLRNGETIHRPSLPQLGIILGIMYLFYMLASFEAEFPDVPMGQHAGDSATMAPIQLTSDERAFIRAHPGIRVGSTPNYPPYDFVENGLPTGYSTELVRMLLERLGFEVAFVAGESWLDLQEKLCRGEIDLLHAADKVANIMTCAHLSPPYIRDTRRFVTRDNFPAVDSIEDLFGRTMAVPASWSQSQEIRQRYGDKIQQIDVANLAQAMELVRQGKADFAVAAYNALRYQLLQGGYQSLKVQGYYIKGDASDDLYIATRKDLPLLQTLVAKAMRSLTPAQKSVVRARWFEPLDDAPMVFSAAERLYLQRKNSITFCIDPHWMPLAGRDAQGQHQGLSAEYLRLVAQRLGIALELRPTADWQTSLEAARQGLCDLLPAIMRTTERAEYLDFTEPYLELPLAVATGLNTVYVQDLRTLESKSVGYVASGASKVLVEEAYPGLHLTPVASVQDGLEQVHAGHLFAFVDLLPTIGYEILRRNSIDLKISGILEQKLSLAMAVRKGDEHLLAMVGRALDLISSGERVLLANQWLRIPVEQRPDYRLIAMLLLLMLALLAGLWQWFRTRVRGVEAARREAERRAKEKGEYLAHLSHEVRTPLYALLGLSQLLENSELNAQQRKWLERLHATCDLLQDIVERVLEYSRAEAKTVAVRRELFTIADLHDALLAQFSDRAKQKGLALRFDLAISRRQAFVGDSTLMLEILGNLLDNSLKFTQQGEVVLRIARCDQRVDWVCFIVQDTGIGIAEGQFQRVLQPFGKGERVTDNSPRSHGLGLAICKELTELLGGALDFTSQPGKGSRFRVCMMLTHHASASGPVRQPTSKPA